VERLVDLYCKLLVALMALGLAVMVVLVFGNVVLRYGFNSGITVSEEVSRWLFVWITFMGAVVALKERAHLGTDVLVSRLSPMGKKICLVIAHALMLYVCWLVFRGSVEQTKINLEVLAPSTQWPVAIVYSAGIVFSVSAGLMLLRNLWRLLRGEFAEEELVQVTESEDLAAIHPPAATADAVGTGPRHSTR
jgi:TRAP-type C4-dicarboxylate transport system permease small subunit